MPASRVNSARADLKNYATAYCCRDLLDTMSKVPKIPYTEICLELNPVPLPHRKDFRTGIFRNFINVNVKNFYSKKLLDFYTKSLSLALSPSFVYTIFVSEISDKVLHQHYHFCSPQS